MLFKFFIFSVNPLNSLLATLITELELVLLCAFMRLLLLPVLSTHATFLDGFTKCSKEAPTCTKQCFKDKVEPTTFYRTSILHMETKLLYPKEHFQKLTDKFKQNTLLSDNPLIRLIHTEAE